MSFFTCGQLNATLYNDCADGTKWDGVLVCQPHDDHALPNISLIHPPAIHSGHACPWRWVCHSSATMAISPTKTAASTTSPPTPYVVIGLNSFLYTRCHGCNTKKRHILAQGQGSFGFDNSGPFNIGRDNTGNSNIGDFNTGSFNTGNNNTGGSNIGNQNTGMDIHV